MSNQDLLVFIQTINYKLEELEEQIIVSEYQLKVSNRGDIKEHVELNNRYRYYKKLKSVLIDEILNDEVLKSYSKQCEHINDIELPSQIKFYERQLKRTSKVDQD